MESDNFFSDLVQMFKERINCESVSLFIHDDSKDSLVLAATAGLPNEIIGKMAYKVGEGITGWVASSAKTLRINSAQDLISLPQWNSKLDTPQYGNPRFRSFLVIPLKDQNDKVLGVIKANNKITPGQNFSEEDQLIGETFAQTAAIALRLEKKNNQLKRLIYSFVLMPFDHAFDDIYKYGIKRPMDELGITCERVDEIQYVGGVLDQVFKCIESARFVIADMTGRNPNVFYEVGYCHALRKDVILCTRSAEDIPFDLRGFNHIVYEGKIATLENALRKRVLALLEKENKSHA